MPLNKDKKIYVGHKGTEKQKKKKKKKGKILSVLHNIQLCEKKIKYESQHRHIKITIEEGRVGFASMTNRFFIFTPSQKKKQKTSAVVFSFLISQGEL